MSWAAAILHLFSQETDLLMKVILKCVNIKLWDILGCFHYILNAPRKWFEVHAHHIVQLKTRCTLPVLAE